MALTEEEFKEAMSGNIPASILSSTNASMDVYKGNSDFGQAPPGTSALYRAAIEQSKAEILKNRGLLGETASDILGGIAEGAHTVLKGIQGFTPTDSSVGQWAGEKAKGLERFQEEHPILQRNPYLAGMPKAIHEGARGAVSALTAGAGGLVAGEAIGGPVGAVAGGAIGLAPFVGAKYQDVMERGQAAGLAPEEVRPTAVGEAGLEGALMGTAGAVLGPLAKPVASAAGKALSGGVKEMFANAVKPAIKHILASGAIFGAQGAATAGIESEMEKNIGINSPDAWEAMSQAFGPGLVSGLIFGGLGAAKAGWRANKFEKALTDSTTDPKRRIEASNVVYDQLQKINPDIAEVWKANAMDAIEAGESIGVSEDIRSLQRRIANLESIPEKNRTPAMQENLSSLGQEFQKLLPPPQKPWMGPTGEEFVLGGDYRPYSVDMAERLRAPSRGLPDGQGFGLEPQTPEQVASEYDQRITQLRGMVNAYVNKLPEVSGERRSNLQDRIRNITDQIDQLTEERKSLASTSSKKPSVEVRPESVKSAEDSAETFMHDEALLQSPQGMDMLRQRLAEEERKANGSAAENPPDVDFVRQSGQRPVLQPRAQRTIEERVQGLTPEDMVKENGPATRLREGVNYPEPVGIGIREDLLEGAVAHEGPQADAMPQVFVKREGYEQTMPSIGDTERMMLEQAKGELAGAEGPTLRVAQSNNGPTEYGRLGSGFPEWFRDRGYTRDQISSTIDKALTGNGILTERQAEIVKDILDQKRSEWEQLYGQDALKGAADVTTKIRSDQGVPPERRQAAQGSQERGSGNLRVPEQEQVKGGEVAAKGPEALNPDAETPPELGGSDGGELSEGKSVPPEALKDYPDLVEKYKANPESTGTTGDLRNVDAKVPDELPNPDVPFSLKPSYAGPGAEGWDEAQGKFSSLYDKKARFEIDDSKAQLRLSTLPEWHKALKAGGSEELGHILKHDDLYQQYPDLAKRIIVEYDTNMKADAAMGKRQGYSDQWLLRINPDRVSKPSVMKDTILHEVQHFIQREEGFAKGGYSSDRANVEELNKIINSRESEFGRVVDELKRAEDDVGISGLRETFNDAANKLFGMGLSDSEINRRYNILADYYESKVNDLKKHPKIVALEGELRSIKANLDNLKNQGEYGAYHHLAGEIEARDSSARADLTPEQRAKTPPYSSENISPQDAIVRFGDGTSSLLRTDHVPEGQGMKRQEVQDHVDQITGTWKNAPKGGFNVHQSESDLLGHYQRKLSGKEGRVEAFYDPGTDSVHFIADNISDPSRIPYLAFHETFVHKGAVETLGPEAHRLFNDMALVKRNEVAAIAEKYGHDMKTPEGRARAAEEWFADQVGQGNYNQPGLRGWWNRFVRIFKEGMRAAGVELNLSDAEIADIAARSRRYIEEGKGGAGAGANPDISMSLKGATDTTGTVPKDESRNYDEFRTTTRRLMNKAMGAARNIKEGIKAAGLPSAISPEHLGAAEVLGKHLGAMNRAVESAGKILRPVSKMFDKLGLEKKGLDLADNPGMKFASDVSQGRPLQGEFKKAGEAIQAQFSNALNALEAAGVPLQSVRDNYFPGMWTAESRRGMNKAIGEAVEKGIVGKDSSHIDWTPEQKQWIKSRTQELVRAGDGSDFDGYSYLSKRPMEGKESFRKAKVFDDIMDAVDLGLEPVSKNPIDLVNLKLAEMYRSAMANSALKEFEDNGQVKTIWAGMTKPKDMVWIEDPKFKEIGHFDDEGKYVVDGQRAVTKPVADIMNNYLSQTLYNNRYVGTLYKGWMGAANILNQAQLGVGSFFHGSFVASESLFSSLANNIKDIYGLRNGTRTMKDVMDGLVHTATAPVTGAKRGKAIADAWFNPGVGSEQTQSIAKAWALGGGKINLETGLQTTQMDQMMRHYYSGNMVQAAIRSPVAMTEMFAAPLMKAFVPYSKLGVFAELADRIIKDNPGKPLESLTPQFRQAVNRIDARLGQVGYDRLFINNTSKNVIQALVRAPGWSGGTIAEVGGGLKDTVKFFQEWKKTGKAPDAIPDRVAYTVALLTGAAVMNGALTAMFTGESPKGLDYWAFRTGGKDEYGRDERFVLPTYAKDIMAYYEHPGHTLLAKTHPMLSMISEAVRNSDYYGTEIRSKDSGPITQFGELAKYGIKQFEPFWVRGVEKGIQRKEGVPEMAAAWAGVMPAPSAINKSEAEKMMSEYAQAHRPAGSRTKEEADKSDLTRGIVRDLRLGNKADAQKSIQDALKAGKLSTHDIKKIQKDASESPLQADFNRLGILEALKVWDVATPQEKKTLRPLLFKKAQNLRSLEPERRAPVMKRLEEIRKESIQ